MCALFFRNEWRESAASSSFRRHERAAWEANLSLSIAACTSRRRASALNDDGPQAQPVALAQHGLPD